tara:strand:+ start:5540 stop:5800 length:261 start_codon:yes stop_codon:yes gene_type:complete
MIITKGNMAYAIMIAIAKRKEMSNDEIADLEDVTRSHSYSTTKRMLAYGLLNVVSHKRVRNQHMTTYSLSNKGKRKAIEILKKEQH